VPRFFFHLIGNGGQLDDPEGIEARDLDAARLYALTAAGEIIAEEMSSGSASVGFTLCIDDNQGARLATMPVAASVELDP
jgi:hypothetical protein